MHPALTFRAGSLFSPNSILYSSSYANIPENEAQFALLHEEGHFTLRQNSGLLQLLSESALWLGLFTIVFYLILVLAVLIGFDFDLRIPSIFIKMVTAAVVILAIPVILIKLLKHKSLMEDEDNADDFAASKLREEYGMQRPSEVLENLLGHLGESNSPLGSMFRITVKLLGGDIHRENHDRVERLRKKFDSPRA